MEKELEEKNRKILRLEEKIKQVEDDFKAVAHMKPDDIFISIQQVEDNQGAIVQLSGTPMQLSHMLTQVMDSNPLFTEIINLAQHALSVSRSFPQDYEEETLLN